MAGATVLLGACADGAGEETVTVTATVTVTEAATEASATPTTVTVTPTTGTPASGPVTTTPPTVTTASTTPVVPRCDPSNFLADFTEPGVLFCDEAWARAGQAQSDHVLVFRYRDGRWRQYQHDGSSDVTGYICYDEGRMRAEGAPEELIAQVLLCEAN